jgi:hypothetical protein
MNPKSALAAWQLIVMAVVPIASLLAWIAAVYLAGRGSSHLTNGTLTEVSAVEEAMFEQHVRAWPGGDQRAA